MKRLLAGLALVSACLHLHAELRAEPPADGRSGKVEVTRLGPGTWLHTTYMTVARFGTFSVNGVIAVDAGEAVIIDLPGSEADTAALFDWVDQQGWRVTHVVPQHFHTDSTGGLPVARERGAKVVMLDKTVALLAATGDPRPDITFERKLSLRYGSRLVELAHLGGGHTVDSVVAWIPEDKVLVGGCLVKSADSTNLGNIADADMAGYPATLAAIRATYPEATIVTPGHGAPGSLDLIDHTLRLHHQTTASAKK